MDLRTVNEFVECGDDDTVPERDGRKRSSAAAGGAHAAERGERAARALDCFGWDPIVDRTIEVYESALAAWKPGHANRGAAELKNHLGFGGRQ